jgi:predicted PurR-regulated permease PerM
MKIEIPIRTYVIFFFFSLLVFFLVLLRFELLLFFIAMIVAMALYAAKKFLMKKGLNEKLASPLIITLYFGVLLAIVFLIIPTFFSQMMDLTDHFPEIKKQVLEFPLANSMINDAQEFIKGSPEIINSAKEILTALGKQTLGGILSMGLFFIVSLYMFMDGARSYRWIRSHCDDKTKKRLDLTVEEIEPVMTAYVFGQATTSTLAAIVVFISATALHIPAAMTLAVLAAFFDILPGIGLILIVLTCALLGLAVSAEAALTIFLILVVYHLFESYVLTPYIYGNRMKLSPLVVLLSLIAAGTIAGVPGMIAVLPIVAAYEPIERRWLKPQPQG